MLLKRAACALPSLHLETSDTFNCVSVSFVGWAGDFPACYQALEVREGGAGVELVRLLNSQTRLERNRLNKN